MLVLRSIQGRAGAFFSSLCIARPIKRSDLAIQKQLALLAYLLNMRYQDINEHNTKNTVTNSVPAHVQTFACICLSGDVIDFLAFTNPHDCSIFVYINCKDKWFPGILFMAVFTFQVIVPYLLLSPLQCTLVEILFYSVQCHSDSQFQTCWRFVCL